LHEVVWLDSFNRLLYVVQQPLHVLNIFPDILYVVLRLVEASHVYVVRYCTCTFYFRLIQLPRRPPSRLAQQLGPPPTLPRDYLILRRVVMLR